MRNRWRFLFVIVMGVSIGSYVHAYEMSHINTSQKHHSTAQISVFVRDNCAHCAAEKQFLTKFAQNYDEQLQIHYHNLSNSAEYEKFLAITTQFDFIKGTPITLVGSKIFQGFDSDDTTGTMIAQTVQSAQKFLTFDDALRNPVYVSAISSLMTNSICTPESNAQCSTPQLTVHAPIIGTKIDVMQYSLTGITLILGLIDGFNPCAMWVLVMFVTLLSQVGSVRRMVQYAGIFIFAEAIMYYTILTVWFGAWDFIGLSRIITPAIGLLAIGSGIYFFYKYITWQPVCSATNAQQQKDISKKVMQLAQKPLTISVVIGILMLAFSVNIFEFACSIGIPQTFTKILEINHLGFWQTQWYMMLYIIMYMLDDVIVLYLAIKGAHKLSGIMKYSKIATLLGGILMVILGILMIFRPEFLVL